MSQKPTILKTTPYTRIVEYDFGALPNNTTKYLAHGLTSEQISKVVKLWGIARDTAAGNTYSLPFSSPTAIASNIQLQIATNGTNIAITTGSNRSSYTAKVYIEYLI